MKQKKQHFCKCIQLCENDENKKKTHLYRKIQCTTFYEYMTKEKINKLVDFRKQSKKLIPNVFVLHLHYNVINIIPIGYLLQRSVRSLGQNKRTLFLWYGRWEKCFTNMQFLHIIDVFNANSSGTGTEMRVLKAQSNKCKGDNEMLCNKDLCGCCERCPRFLHLTVPISNKKRFYGHQEEW